MKIDVQIKGAEQAIGKLKAHQLLTKENVKQVIAESTISIKGGTVSRTPVDTGNLKNSWNSELENNGLTGIISNPVEYAPHVEWGTVKMSAQPMLTHSYEEEMPIYLRNLKKALKRT